MTINTRTKTKTTKRNSKFYLTVYEYIKQNSKLPLHLASHQELNYYLKHLKQQGYVKRKGYGTWGITSKLFNINAFKTTKTTKTKLTNSHTRSDSLIRGHSFQFTLKIKSISNWDKRVQYLKQKNISHKLVYGKNPSISLDGYTIHLNNTSLVFYSDSGLSYFSKDAKSSRLEAVYNCKKLIKKLESMLGIDFKINKNYVLKVSKQ